MEALESLSDRLSEMVNAVVGPAADFMSSYVWGWPSQFPLIAAVLLATGMFVTIRLPFDGHLAQPCRVDLDPAVRAGDAA